MKHLVLLLTMIPFSASHAETRTIAITDVDFPEDRTSEIMVKASTGEVFWVNQENLAVASLLVSKQVRAQLVEIDENRRIPKATFLAKKASSFYFEAESEEQKNAFTPTIFSNEADIRNAFDSLDNRTHEDSQCYNRAHPWAYDMWRTRGISSMKIFLFFTNKYIRAYRHKWWFHVAPMTYLRTPEGNKEYVLDRSYSQFPLFTRVWTNTFIQNQAECRSVNSYYEYFKDSPVEWCYLIRSTMYYRGTVALRKRDQGTLRTRWNLNEMREAREQAFIYASEYNP